MITKVKDSKLEKKDPKINKRRLKKVEESSSDSFKDEESSSEEDMSIDIDEDILQEDTEMKKAM